MRLISSRASRIGWHAGMAQEDRVDDLDDHALTGLVDKVPDGLAAWWRMVDGEPWEVVAERMAVSPRMAQRRIPPAWGQVLAIPVVLAIITTAPNAAGVRIGRWSGPCMTVVGGRRGR
jgi:hypothetical protein